MSTDTKNIIKYFRLIRMAEQKASVDDVLDELEISPRTLFRYIATLRSLNFPLHNKGGYLAMDTKDYAHPSMFSFDEMTLVHNMAKGLPNQNRLKTSLLDKLKAYLGKETPQEYFRIRLSGIIHEVQKSIEDGKRIKLENYRSASGNTVKTRTVEPIRFSEDYVFLHAIDVSDEKLKVFKIDRVSDVKPLHIRNKLAQNTEISSDIFGMSGQDETLVEVKMNLRSRLLLEEEFPKAGKFISKSGNDFILKTPVHGFRGIARFVLGLLDETEVIAPQELKDYLNKKVENRGF